MAFLGNIFKKGGKEAKKTKKAALQTSEKSKSPDKEKEVRKIGDTSERRKDAYYARKPWISEKATILGEQNMYVFEVDPNSNKKMIKEEIEDRYKVGIKSIRTVRSSGKTKKFRHKTGKRSGFKKAIVTLNAGDKIDMV